MLSHNTVVAKRYVPQYKVGQGKAGGAVYGVKDVCAAEGLRLALKYPVKPVELEVLQSLQKAMSDPHNHLPKCQWMPKLLDFGLYGDEPYIVTDLLGHPLPDLVSKFKGSLKARWRYLRLLGRLMLRRLQAVHMCGFVHCDVQPANILLGQRPEERPYLIDFGAAVPYPGGGPQRSDRGSLDYNSIRTAEGGVRGPYDDLESLGWVLCNGLFGDLPWFKYTSRADWSHGSRLSDEDRPVVCENVRAAKAALLDESLETLGQAWSHLAEIPSELLEYLRICRAHGSDAERASRPDYVALAATLGGANADDGEAELADLVHYRRVASGEEEELDESESPQEGEPRPIRVHVTHAAEEDQSQISVEVMSTATILDVRRAMLALLGESKLSQVKLVRKWGTGYATLPDTETIGDRRELLSFGRSLSAPPKPTESAAPTTLTLPQAIDLQRALMQGYGNQDFQAKLLKLRAESASRKQARQEYQDLMRSVQNVVLPRFGFEATSSGVEEMIQAIDVHWRNPEINDNSNKINDLASLSVRRHGPNGPKLA